MKNWLVNTEDGGNNVHVVPVEDEVEHTKDEDCICGPRVEFERRDDGSGGWVIIHQALDGPYLVTWLKRFGKSSHRTPNTVLCA